MSASGYTPLQIYSSSTASNVPLAANLSNTSNGAELAINITDGKLFYKDNTGVVQTIAAKAGVPGTSSNTQVLYNSSGAIAGSANLTFDGTNLTVSGAINAITLNGAGFNQFIGTGVATSITSGTYNFCAGSTNGRYINSGSYNTLVGFNAGRNITTGSSNTLLGLSCGYGITTSSNNVFLGDGIGFAITTGFANTVVGSGAGYSITSGYNNTFLGYGAGVNSQGGVNNLCLGFGSGTDALVNITTQSNYVVLGNNSTTTFYCKTSTITTSDIRDKTSVRPVSLGLNFVNQINPIAYQFKTSREDDTASSRFYLGWSAQDVLAGQGTEQIVDDSDPEHLKMAGMDMVAVLWKAVQELSAEVAQLKSQLGVQ